MTRDLSERLRAAVDALPLREGMRVLEIGCGPGAAAREVARRIGDGHVHAIDRSPRAIAQAVAGSEAVIASGRLTFQQVAAEDFTLPEGEPSFDLAFAVRVGALDGRHPEAGRRALERIAAVLTPTGRLLVGDGSSMVEIRLPR
ncbi:cyclopropane-fatty-acyl-phospholipid synthase family protein [Streptomyces sp. TLI_185]|uniref:SAM-dependent methyltransferase n=1 Tax=Streptomyces sp. TLI_185 TaxID=2485151 RepID=UPI000F4D90E8|nr:class I SAM-dependent methyltransferase [Streptomyces sp. TLI_185]RPF34275.1 methyltransferase family protein [Streptomyces sp. TLI_185]